MIVRATRELLRKLRDEGYTMLVAGRMCDTAVFFPEKGAPEAIIDSIYSLPLQEDQAISITDALNSMTNEELNEICVITFLLTDSSGN